MWSELGCFIHPGTTYRFLTAGAKTSKEKMRVDEDNEDEVTFDDMLDAMADSLLDLKTQPTIINVPDKKIVHQPTFKNVKKPPRELFYNDSIRFAPKPPMPVLRQLCTCRYLCHGAKAVIKCLSCALYEPSGISYYCTMCFNARHPWHRVTHIYTSIYQDELIGINMKLQREQIESDRYMVEGNRLMEKVVKGITDAEKVADDTAVEASMLHIGRRIHHIEDRLRNMRHDFRATLSASDLTFSDEDGIGVIQRTFRGFRIRRVLSLLYVERVIRVWDAMVGRG